MEQKTEDNGRLKNPHKKAEKMRATKIKKKTTEKRVQRMYTYTHPRYGCNKKTLGKKRREGGDKIKRIGGKKPRAAAARPLYPRTARA